MNQSNIYEVIRILRRELDNSIKTENKLEEVNRNKLCICINELESIIKNLNDPDLFYKNLRLINGK